MLVHRWQWPAHGWRAVQVDAGHDYHRQLGPPLWWLGVQDRPLTGVRLRGDSELIEVTNATCLKSTLAVTGNTTPLVPVNPCHRQGSVEVLGSPTPPPPGAPCQHYTLVPG
jgi:hypothetical protein